MPFMCCFILCSPLKSSFVSVVFDFNASLNDVAPVSSILLSVDLIKMQKGRSLVNTVCVVSFAFTFQIEFSECCV